MWIILDILVVAVVVACIFIYRNKGFVSSVLGIGAFIVALLLATWLSKAAAPVIYDNFVRDSIINEVNERVQDGENGFLGNLIVQRINESEEARAAGTYTPSAIEQSAISTIRSLTFVILFVLLSLILRIVVKFLKGVNKIPLVGGINRLLGAVLGAVAGLLFVYIGVSLCAIIVAASSDSLSWLNTEMIDKSFIFSTIYNINLLRVL